MGEAAAVAAESSRVIRSAG